MYFVSRGVRTFHPWEIDHQPGSAASGDTGDNRTRRALAGSEGAPQQIFLAHEARR